MQAFKQRGVLALSILMFFSLWIVETIKRSLGLDTGMLGNALVVASLALVWVVLLRHFGFRPFVSAARK